MVINLRILVFLALLSQSLLPITAQVYELRQEYVTPATRYSSGSSQIVTRTFVVIDTKGPDGMVDLYGLAKVNVRFPSYGVGAATLQTVSAYRIDGHCRHYMHNGSLILPSPHHISMGNVRAASCPVSLYFYGDSHGYESATILPRSDLTKMALSGSTRVTQSNGRTVVSAVSQLPWSETFFEDSRGLVESAARRSAYSVASSNVSAFLNQARQEWGRVSLAKDQTFNSRFQRLVGFYPADQQYYWQQRPTAERYKNYVEQFTTGIVDGSFHLNNPEWLAEACEIGGSRTGPQILWDLYDYTYDVISSRGNDGKRLDELLVTYAETLVQQLEREKAAVKRVQEQIAGLARAADTLLYVGKALEGYAKRMSVIPQLKGGGIRPDCQASSNELWNYTRCQKEPGSCYINTRFSLGLPSQLTSCPDAKGLAQSYTLEGTADEFYSLEAKYSAVATSMLHEVAILSDSSYNSLSWRRFNRFSTLLASVDSPFVALKYQPLQISILTLGGVPDSSFQAPKDLMQTIVSHIYEWYVKHRDFDVDDWETTLPPNIPGNTFAARTLWKGEAYAERCVAELFVYMSNYIVVDKYTLSDVIDDADMPEILSTYFGVNEDIVEKYLKTIIESSRLHEFGIANSYGNVPTLRIANVKEALVEPEPPRPKQEKTGGRYLTTVYIEDDEPLYGNREPEDQSKQVKMASIELTKFIAENLIRIVANARNDVSESESALIQLHDIASKCAGMGKRIGAVSSSSTNNIAVQRTNVPSIATSDICATLREYSVSRGYSPMWKTNSTQLLDDLLRRIRENHGEFVEQYERSNELFYDPAGREWLTVVSNTTYRNDSDCKGIGPFLALGFSFGPKKATVTSLRIGVEILSE